MYIFRDDYIINILSLTLNGDEKFINVQKRQVNNDNERKNNTFIVRVM